jgi:hypothetical protein
MPEGNRTAVHINACGIGVHFAQPRNRHRRERFVHFVKIDVADFQIGFLQRAFGGGDRRFLHDHLVMTDDRQMHDAGKRPGAKRLQTRFAGEQHAGSAIADLA